MSETSIQLHDIVLRIIAYNCTLSDITAWYCYTKGRDQTCPVFMKMDCQDSALKRTGVQL